MAAAKHHGKTRPRPRERRPEPASTRAGALDWPLTDGLFHLLNAIIFKLKALTTRPHKLAPDRSGCSLNVGATFAATFAIYLNPAASEVKCDSL